MAARSRARPTPTRWRASWATRCRCGSWKRRRRVSSSACSEPEEDAMSLLDFLRPRPKNTANIARERLRIIVAQERATRGGPDYLPLLRNELLEVIRKYVHVGADAVQINVERSSDGEVLELSVALPEGGKATGTGG